MVYYRLAPLHTFVCDRDSLPVFSLPLPQVDTAFDHLVFHSPYNKLVAQSFRRMMFNDARRFKQNHVALPPSLAPLEAFADLPYEKTIGNRDLDKAVYVSLLLRSVHSVLGGFGSLT